MKLSRKAQVGGLQGFVLSIVTVAIVLAIGLTVMGELNTTSKEMDTTSALNETVTTASALKQSALLVSTSACRNLSNQEVFEIGLNCNISTAGVVLVNPNNGTIVSIDYTHYTPSAAFNSTGTLITKLATVPTWIGIIIIVALAFIVLSFFIGKRQ